MDVQLETGLPVANGVLTTENEEQALARRVKGAEAARVAVEMANYAEGGGRMKNSRRRAREIRAAGLYQWQFTGEDAAQVLKNLSELEGFERPTARSSRPSSRARSARPRRCARGSSRSSTASGTR